MVALTPIVTLCCTLQQLQLEGSHMFGRSAGTNLWPPSTSRHSAGGEGGGGNDTAVSRYFAGKTLEETYSIYNFLSRFLLNCQSTGMSIKKTNPVRQLHHWEFNFKISYIYFARLQFQVFLTQPLSIHSVVNIVGTYCCKLPLKSPEEHKA